jgi:CheY-like chemotaxis protein
VDGTGVEAVRMIMAHLGPIPVVYVTGHAKALDDQDNSVVVPKPIRPNVLAGAWQHALRAA